MVKSGRVSVGIQQLNLFSKSYSNWLSSPLPASRIIELAYNAQKTPEIMNVRHYQQSVRTQPVARWQATWWNIQWGVHLSFKQGTLQRIFQQPMIIKSRFNFLNALPVNNESQFTHIEKDVLKISVIIIASSILTVEIPIKYCVLWNMSVGARWCEDEGVTTAAKAHCENGYPC